MIEEEKLEEPIKCIKCGNETTNIYWMFIWKRKMGNACEPCGNEIHNIGYYLLDKAADLYKKHGILISCTKEKFGRFEIYAYAETEEQRQVIRETQEFYKRAYPEFTWELGS